MIGTRPVYTVTQINTYIKGRLDGDRNLSGVYIRGEISNYKRYPSGHHYFTLKDKTGAAALCYGSAPPPLGCDFAPRVE